MRITARQDVEAPIAEVFAQATDHVGFERQALRRGADVRRTDRLGEGAPDPITGFGRLSLGTPLSAASGPTTTTAPPTTSTTVPPTTVPPTTAPPAATAAPTTAATTTTTTTVAAVPLAIAPTG